MPSCFDVGSVVVMQRRDGGCQPCRDWDGSERDQKKGLSQGALAPRYEEERRRLKSPAGTDLASGHWPHLVGAGGGFCPGIDSTFLGFILGKR